MTYIYKISDLIAVLQVAGFTELADYQIIERGIMLWVSPTVAAWLDGNGHKCESGLVDVWH